MKKVLLIIVLSIVALSSVFSTEDGAIYSFANRFSSPLRSVSYFGNFMDFFTNPATLPLVEDNQGSFMCSINYSDYLPFSSFSTPTGYMNNTLADISLSFVGRNVALTANIGSSFINKTIKDDLAYFDIYSNIDIEIDWGFALPYFSFGVSIGGGNSLVRTNKRVSNPIDAVANSLFSPFERSAGSERFSLGAGMLLYFDYFSIGLNIHDILTLNDENSISADWETIGKSSTVSFAAFGPKFNKNGDLAFILPRVSLSFSDFLDQRYTFSIKGDLSFQFLPDSSLDIAVGYREVNHKFFGFNGNNGFLDVYLSGEFLSMNLTLGVTFDCKTFSTFSPVVGFSYAG